MILVKFRGLFIAALTLLACTSQIVPAAPVNSSSVKLKVCSGEFALCASSIGTLTGKTITVRSFDGQSQTFPETVVMCPIVKGTSIAALNSNTMGSSCKAPKGQVYSLFGPNSYYPQEALNWEIRAPVAQECAPQPTKLMVGTFAGQTSQAISQCWSMACTKAGKAQNGAPLAACSCAFGEAPIGGIINPSASSATFAGYGNSGACSRNPVAGALPVG